MKKVAVILIAVVSLFTITAARVDAGAHGGGFHGGGFHGHQGFHHGFRGRVVIGGGVFIGPGWGPYWDPYGYPYYSPAYAAAAYPLPMVAEPATYVQQQGSASYWYYCESARAYYPYVQQCPTGWLTVVPSVPTEGTR